MIKNILCSLNEKHDGITIEITFDSIKSRDEIESYLLQDDIRTTFDFFANMTVYFYDNPHTLYPSLKIWTNSKCDKKLLFKIISYINSKLLYCVNSDKGED